MTGMMFHLVLLVVGVVAAVEKTVGQDSAGRQKHDQLQDEILKAMKDSGVLNEWKDKLDDLLYKDNDVDVDSIIKKASGTKPVKKPVINPQELEMISSFVEEYVSDKNLNVKTDLILGIVERVQKTPKPNLAQIFVQLGPVIEVISAIQLKTKDVEKIIDRQAPVFDSPAKTKDVLHTLSENLKSELVRLTLDSPPPATNKNKAKKSPPPPKEKKKPAAGFGGLELSDYLSLGSTLLKGGNAGQMMDLLSGKADMASMLALLPSLIENGNYKDILTKMAGSYLEGTPYGPMVQQYASGMLESQQGKAAVETVYTTLEKFIKSESGKRLTKVVPQLMAAKDMESMLQIIGKEAEWNWSMFFANIDNSDYKDNFLDTLAEYVVKAYDFFANPPKDSMISKAPIIINGFLISNRIPAFDMKSPVDSLTKIINKCIKLFTKWKLDVTPYAKVISLSFKQAFEKQAGGNSLSKLQFSEKKALVARLLDHELMSPVQTVWEVYTFMGRGGRVQCGPHLLCLVNQREAKAGQGPSRVAVTKGSSLAVAWALSQTDNDAYFGLYKAIARGGQGDDCTTAYPVKGDSCKVFSWQKKKDIMNTEYDHLEL